MERRKWGAGWQGLSKKKRRRWLEKINSKGEIFMWSDAHVRPNKESHPLES